MEARPSDDRRGRPSLLRHATWPVLLVAAVFLFLFREAFDYFGWVSALAEWQFAHFHQWYPMLTALVVCAAAGLLWLVGATLYRRRRRQRGDWLEIDERADRIRQTGIAAAALMILAGLCAVTVLAGLAYWWRLPTMQAGQARPWNLAGPMREGRTSLTNARTIGPVARYREAILGIGADQYFAPIARAADRDDAPLTLFVELTPGPGRPALPPGQDGLLRVNALPGELASLYRDAGYAVDARSAVIFRDDAASGRSTLVFMIEALAAASISLAFGTMLRRRYRRLRDRFEQEPV